MYVKVFNQIFDSSIADDYKLRHFFTDMLVLADINGVVDMTATAIAARTRIPLEEVVSMLAKLEQPDPESRTPDHDGRRIALLDDHRTWGWCIINYDRFRKTSSEEQRREKTAARTRAYKLRKAEQNSKGDAVVTHGDAGDAMQRQMQREKQMQESSETCAKVFAPACEENLQKVSLEEAKTFAKRKHIRNHILEAWFSACELSGWRLVDKLTGREQPIKDWQAALIRYAEVFTPPTIDKMNNKEFWEWVRTEELDEEQVNNWVACMKRKNWLDTNTRTGKIEPVFDFKVHCLGYLNHVDASNVF